MGLKSGGSVTLVIPTAYQLDGRSADKKTAARSMEAMSKRAVRTEAVRLYGRACHDDPGPEQEYFPTITVTSCRVPDPINAGRTPFGAHRPG